MIVDIILGVLAFVVIGLVLMLWLELRSWDKNPFE